MNAREMHFDFRLKFNQINTQQQRSLRVEEVDWVINEAMSVYIEAVAFPRNKKKVSIGFEVGQRTIDDIRTLVVEQDANTKSLLSKVDDFSYLCSLPSNYRHYIKSTVIADKGVCTNQKLKTHVILHGDLAEESSFSESNFEWRECNIRFYDKGIRVFSDGTFIPKYLYLEYIREPKYFHNAQDAIGGTYTLLDGEVLTGSQPCELPNHTHRQIVDLAALIAVGYIKGEYQLKQAKFALSE